MNKEAKEFRSKYFYTPRKSNLSHEKEKSLEEKLEDIKPYLEEDFEDKECNEKSLEEKLRDIKPYLEEDFENKECKEKSLEEKLEEIQPYLEEDFEL